MISRRHEDEIRGWYGALTKAWGPQHWWPAQSRFEVIAGAFLTQNTAWTNVERALRNLRQARALNLSTIRRIPLAELEQLVRPAGYFRQKAQRLKTFVRFLDERYGGRLERMYAANTPRLREELLALNGVGPETADSILLYGGSHASFVVDAYTRRVVTRHGLLPFHADYDAIRLLFERALGVPVETLLAASLPNVAAPVPHPPSRMSRARRGQPAQRYNEMHGLLVNVGKHHCHKRAPQCEGCPLQPFLPRRGPRPLVDAKAGGRSRPKSA